MKRNWWKWALGAFAALLVLAAIVGEDEEPDTAKAKPSPRVTLEIAPVAQVVKAKTVALSGKVTPVRATVEVGTGHATTEIDVAADGAFSTDVELPRLGENDVTASARLGSRRAATARIVVERRLSRAEVAAKRERVRKRREAAARERERREAARADRLAAKQEAAEKRAAREAAAAEPEPTPDPEPTSGCDPNYSGCVPIASDVDCEGGSGDGPAYTGVVTVIGTDLYDLDSDSDGTACE